MLRADTVATPRTVLQPGWVLLDGGTIEAIGSGNPPPGVDIVELGNRIVAPGFVDLHVHGGDGAQVNPSADRDLHAALAQLTAFHARHGTTSLVATTVSDTPDALIAAVAAVAAYRQAGVGGRATGAEILGTHLEGPWLSPLRAGAHSKAALRPPGPSELAGLLDAAAGTIRIVTLAPELAGADALIAAALEAGVVVSVGHTDADFETTRAAFGAGARHVTHLFNAMPPIHHRRPGPIAAALADERISVELIADGIHVNPVMIRLVAGLAAGRIVLVSDATPAAGLGEGHHRLGPVEVTVRGRRVTMSGPSADDGTIAGSVLTLDEAISFTVGEAGLPLAVALEAATLTPADLIGESRKGRVASGADADLVVLDSDLSVCVTLVAGRVVHDPAALMAGRLSLPEHTAPGS